MGSGVETARETADWLNGRGEKVGVLSVRLYLAFSVQASVAALPPPARAARVLDRAKAPGAVGEPLYQAVAVALREAFDGGIAPMPHPPRLIGGRYGLSSKEFTPAMVKAVFDELAPLLLPSPPSDGGEGRVRGDRPKNHFTVGIVDDVTHTSLPCEELDTEPDDVVRAVFFGLGAD